MVMQTSACVLVDLLAGLPPAENRESNPGNQYWQPRHYGNAGWKVGGNQEGETFRACRGHAIKVGNKTRVPLLFLFCLADRPPRLAFWRSRGSVPSSQRVCQFIL